MTDKEDSVHIAEAQPITGKGGDVRQKRLSIISQQYDIDGDGVLDEAELASESVKPVLSRARHRSY